MVARRLLLALAAGPAMASLLRPGAARAQQPGRRVALVIGNGTYSFAPILANPVADARSIAARLQPLGFQTTLLLDAGLPDMRAALQRLGEAASGADACLLFYAGHALEMDGRNYLIPVSAQVQGAADLAREALRFDDITTTLGGRARTTLVFLDSCRDNPFPAVASLRPVRGGGTRPGATRSATPGAGPGLASVASTAGMLIAFATAPGNVALDGTSGHSPFTEALLQHIATPVIEIRDMLGRVRRTVREGTGGQQIPWDNSSLEAGFYMAPSRAGGADHPSQATLDAFTRAAIPIPPALASMAYRHGPGTTDVLVGSWSSAGGGFNRTGRQAHLVVLSLDAARGTGDVVFGQGPPAPHSINQEQGARSHRRLAQIVGTSLEWTELGGTTYSFVNSGPDRGVLSFRTSATSEWPNRKGLVRMERIE